MTVLQKKEALANFLTTLSKKENVFIQVADKRLGHKFAVAANSETGGLGVLSNFMTYEEMNAFFSGILYEREKRIKF